MWHFGASMLRKLQLRSLWKLRSLSQKGLGPCLFWSCWCRLHLVLPCFTLFGDVFFGCSIMFKQTFSTGKFLWTFAISCTDWKLSTTRKIEAWEGKRRWLLRLGFVSCPLEHFGAPAGGVPLEQRQQSAQCHVWFVCKVLRVSLGGSMMRDNEHE